MGPTITVNTKVDSSGIEGEEVCTGAVGVQCTLREAIATANVKANAVGEPDTISFAGILAGSVLEIEEASLPEIFEGVTINGGTAEGATAGVPAIELVPVPASFEGGIGSVAGLSVEDGVGTRIEGLAIGGFGEGIHIGPTEDGVATATSVCGNYLGVKLNGVEPNPNAVGVEISAAVGEQPEGTAIGNPAAGCAGNAISGNSEFGVSDAGLETTIAGNSIGIGPQPSGQILPNGAAGKTGDESAGIYVAPLAAGTVIGGTENSGENANFITQNHGPGVFVEAAATAVTIRHNSFTENEGLGIQIAGGGPPVPTITSARSSAPTSFHIEGTVEGETDDETVAIEVFGNPTCDPSGSGEGQTFLGRGSFQAQAGPNTYSFSPAVAVPADDTAITTTVTREDGTTTQFSECATYEPPPQTFTVTTAADTEHGGCGATCSLREAIEAANATPTADTIDFNTTGTIQASSRLPPITAPVEIDGTSAPGYAGAPLIGIDGSAIAKNTGSTGLVVRSEAGGTSISGLAIGGFETGVLLEGTANQVCGSYLGLAADGMTALANEIGIEAAPLSTEDQIGAGCGALGGGNIVSGNATYGIADHGAETRIADNRIGIDANGVPMPNGTDDAPGGGIAVNVESRGALIGRIDGAAANVIANNGGPGILVERSLSEAEIRGNSIFANEGLGIEVGMEPPVPPTVEALTVEAGTLTFEGEATAGPSEEAITIDFFAGETCDPSGAGEGQTYLGNWEENSLGGATHYETEPLPGTLPAGEYYITATSTGSVLGQTTEFSQCFHYEPPAFVVNTLADSNDGECGATCSLRDAIEAANELPDRNLIEFSAGAVGTIALGVAELPPLTEPVTIDGTLAPGWTAAGGPVVRIDGSATKSDGSTQGLYVGSAAVGSAISGVAIEDFGRGVTLIANHVSLDYDRVAYNSGAGVLVAGSAPRTQVRRTTLFADAGGSIEFETPSATQAPEVLVSPAGPTTTTIEVPVSGAVPDQDYAIDVFASAQCEKPGEFGPAEVLLGSGQVTADAAGEAQLTMTAELAGIDAESFTATATDVATGTTSQIGRCARIAPETEIESGPAGVTPATGATFTFSGFSYGHIAGHECSLDGAAFAPCSSPQSYAGLADGAHTFSVRSVNGEGFHDSSPPSVAWTVETPKANPPAQGPPAAQPSVVTPTPEPMNGETIVVKPEEGKVKIKLPGTKKYVPLEELKEIPVGAVIDATKGKVTLTSVDPDGTEQSANFFGGVFKVKQKEGSGLVVLELLDTGVCPAPRTSARAAVGALAARPGSGTSGKLWGSGHGNFKTEGNQGSATVRGTIWLVEDRCDGTTFFKTRRGVVSVKDFVTHKTLSLPAGKTYVAGEEG